MSGLEVLAVGATLAVASVLLFVVVLVVWWIDRYDREPLPLLLGVLFWGLVMAPGLVGLAAQVDFLHPTAGLGSGPGCVAVFSAAAVEEVAKALGILLVVVLSRHFDNPTDGLVYGTAVGLGFAITENLFHGFGAANGLSQALALQTIIGRTLYTAGVHALASSVIGAGFGMARLSGRVAGRWLWGFSGFFVAVALHGGWNFAVLSLSVSTTAGYRPWMVLFPLYFAFAATFALLLHAEHRVLIRQLADEVRLGVLPGWTVNIIPYYRRRVRANWWPSRSERTVISRLLTKLAFRKHALATAGRSEGDLDGLELVSLRKHIQCILRTVEDDQYVDISTIVDS